MFIILFWEYKSTFVSFAFPNKMLSLFTEKDYLEALSETMENEI